MADRALVVEVVAKGFDGAKFTEWLQGDEANGILTITDMTWLPGAIQNVWGNLLVLNPEVRKIYDRYHRMLEVSLGLILARFLNTDDVRVQAWPNDLLACAELRRLILETLETSPESIPEQVNHLSGRHKQLAELFVQILGDEPREEFLLRLILGIFLHDAYIQCAIDGLERFEHNLEN